VTLAIVPAAGSSRRMGRPKLLLPFGDTTVAGSLLAALRRGGAGRIVVVIAPHDEALRANALAAGAEVAVNENPERGMLSSILAGVERLGGAAALAAAGEPLLITPADLPAIRPATILALIATLERGARLAVPTYRGKRGHPLAIDPALVPSIAAVDPNQGLRQLLDRHAVTELEVEDRGVIADVDTPADYATLNEAGD
jgi:molybdenum cofactor cytidylyltransferase